MINLVKLFCLCISISILSCSSSKNLIDQSHNSFYNFKSSGDNYIVVNIVGGHSSGGDGEIFSSEKLFTAKIPNGISKSSLSLGRSFIHQFWYGNKSVFIVVDKKYPVDIKREDSISRTAFLTIIDTIRDFRSPFFLANNKNLKKNRSFGIVSKGSFILCYMNIRKRDIPKVKKSFDSFVEIK